MSRRKLTKEEKELWGRIASTAKPMHSIRREPKTMANPKKTSVSKVEYTFTEFKVGQKVQPNGPSFDLKPDVRQSVSSAPLQMDHKAFGKLKRGKLSPEAKLDLHGMTLAQAHPALIRFVTDAYASGLRLVLVITGKGKRGVDDGPIPRQVGVLRHQVPQWLRHAPIGPMILQVSEAHVRHGGSGAYYIYLRRHR